MSSNLIIFPIILPLFAAAIALLLRRHHQIQAVFSFFAMLVSLTTSVAAFMLIWQSGEPLIFRVGLWPALFGISFMGDPLSITFVVMAQFVIWAGMLYALGSKDQSVRYPAFYPLFLTLATGLTGTFLTADLFNLFVFAELLVASSAVLTAVSDDKNGVEAAYKYFYISLIASVFLLISVSISYTTFGTLNMADLAKRIAEGPNHPIVLTGIIFLLVFFMIKSAVVPFHFWLPDFHTTSPTAISAMLSSVVVKLGIYGMLRMTTLIFPSYADPIRQILLTTGIIGVFFGGLGAIKTYNLKRTLAYSTIAQLGFILTAIGWGSPLALAAAIIFTINHSLIKSAMLMLAGVLASRAQIKSADYGNIDGLGKSFPVVGALFLFGGMALAGLPPMNGFISKLTLFKSGLSTNEYISLGLLGLGSLISLIYVGKAYIRIWWQSPEREINPKKNGDWIIAPLLLIGICLMLGIAGEPLLRLAEWNVEWMSQPTRYIQVLLGSL